MGETRLNMPVARPRGLRIFTQQSIKAKKRPWNHHNRLDSSNLDSGSQWLDSGFHLLDSGFQSGGFRIPQTKITWIPDSGLPYMGRHAVVRMAERSKAPDSRLNTFLAHTGSGRSGLRMEAWVRIPLLIMLYFFCICRVRIPPNSKVVHRTLW